MPGSRETNAGCERRGEVVHGRTSIQKPAQWAGQQLANGEAELRRGLAVTRMLQTQSGRPATIAER
eukprot:9560210-Alexandrium_andersonii.AAC.1